MRSITLIGALALAGCASRAQPAAQPRDEVGPTPEQAPRGRPAGMQIIQFGSQRTFWLMNCPTDSPSPLREQCSLTRAEEDYQETAR
jgi:hypothetical protein